MSENELRCPKCGARVFRTDSVCMDCGGDLSSQRAQQERQESAGETREESVFVFDVDENGEVTSEEMTSEELAAYEAGHGATVDLVAGAGRKAEAVMPEAKAERDGVEPYYGLMDQIEKAIEADDYQAAVRLCKRSLPLVPRLIAQCKREYGRFDIGAIPAIEEGTWLLAAFGEQEGLAYMREMLLTHRELKPWAKYLGRSELIDRILALIAERPGVLQKDIKGILEGTEPYEIGWVCSRLGQAGAIRRETAGSSFALYLSGPVDSGS